MNTEFKFFDYYKEKPQEVGFYIWKLENNFNKDFVLIFTAKYIERNFCFQDSVLTPEFSRWDGYQLVLPKGSIEWAFYDEEEQTKSYEILDVVGVKNERCPFCKKIPKWKYCPMYISACPTTADYYYLKCCDWVTDIKMRNKNPIELAKKRNELLKK